MRLQIIKSKNAQSLYVVKSVYRNKKRTNKVVEKLGTYEKLKQNLKIPVIGNGDVVDSESYKKMLETGVDGVMIGRGSQGRPWIFSEILGKTFEGDKFEVIKRHVDVLRRYYDESWLTLYMRKHFLWYVNGITKASEIRLKLAISPSIDESLQLLQELFKK